MVTTRTKIIFTAVMAVALFVCGNVKAQSVSKSKFRFGIGVDGLLPVGDFEKTANFGLGISPRLQYGIANNVALTLTSGFYHFFTKDIYVPEGFLGAGQKIQTDLDIVPVKVGIKAFLSSSVYLGAEAGAGFRVDNGGGSTKFIASPTLGYATKRWDFGARYESFSGQGETFGVIGLRIAYGFGL